ncbi:aldehyde dehydrogenase family protein [Cytobacillus kochii]|uniref:aldehyde dehydrogenase family protein n=1 Tax=Cytobacillus kochii TaxID=859143 RepID=UPI0020406E3C|nr:aldehyde dehydrogenase family protein [Cytobacillus kochii]MCM3324845.1 aldehyde dehydrogenase family protein [Cytobacillus kochii]MCM3347238.1 aldehyde dehydrogenase family protein [Cytobacillus kochii]
MRNYTKHYINGEWVTSTGSKTIDVINPATEEVMGKISSGTEEDLDKAVAAAKAAFPSFSQTSVEERIELLERICQEYEKRKDDIIEVITEELGSPVKRSNKVHYQMGLQHFKQAVEELKTFKFEEERGNTLVRKEAIGVAGLITPWNFPTNQTSTKLASAFAAGSTVVLKPASNTPFAAMILAEIFEAAGLPKGVFNLVTGSGSTIGNGISSHPDIDFVSFTGSGEVGQKIMENAASTIKKVSLELGGKSPLIVLDDADIKGAAKTAVALVAGNTGQVCTAATRTLIPKGMHDEFVEAVKEVIENFPVGDPTSQDVQVGPLVDADQWERVQSYIKKGSEEGAELIAGGPGKPEGLEKGYYTKITAFTNVKNDMTIAQEEIFGPVMSILTYDNLDEAIEIANDTIYGLAGYVYGGDRDTLQKVAKGIRAGQIQVNNSKTNFSAPFGGFKQSGIGREWGDFGIEEFLEPKSIIGYYA